MDYPGDELAAADIFCFSLRRRGTWASAAVQLLQSNKKMWKEANLGTHDLSLCIPRPKGKKHEAFQLILLSSTDIDDARAIGRIQELHRLGGGSNVAVVFLLDRDGSQGGMEAFMRLHIQIVSTCMMPIIPLAAVDALPAALEGFRSSLMASRTAHPAPADATRDLLPYCTIGTPLSRYSVDVLGMSCLSFRQLLAEIGLDEGRRRIRSVLEPAEAESLLSFWAHEFSTA